MKDEQKIWIRGVDGRGSEVIKTLEDRGGCNHCGYDGEDPDGIYFISHEGSIRYKFSECEFGKVIMDNYRELKLPEQWKDGDILINNDGTDYKVFWEYDSDTVTSFYAHNVSMHVNGTLTQYSGSIWHGEKMVCFIEDYRLATNSEVKRFHELLNKCGKDWDSEKKRLVNWKWKPQKGEVYWTIIVGITIYKLKLIWAGDAADKIRYELGNCFRTCDEVNASLTKVKLLFNKE